MRPGWCAALAILQVALFATAAGAAILDQSGAGVVPVNDEKLVVILGVEGEVLLQNGDKGTVEFESSTFGKAGQPLPIALSTNGEAFGFDPPSGQALVKRRLRVLVPAGMSVVLEVQNVTVHASQLDSAFSLRGSRIRLQASGLLRRSEIDIDGGNVVVQSAAQNLTLKGKDIEAKLDGIRGPAVIRLTGGSARLTGLQSGLQAELVRTRLVVDTISGPVDLRLQEGKAQLVSLRDGGQITASVCPLILSQVGGDLTVTSDSDVQFSDSRATIRIGNTAGSVTGIRNEGVVDIGTNRARVGLTQIGGQLRVSGDELEITMKDIGASTTINTRSSNISIDGSAGVTVENNRGNVAVKGSEALIDVRSQNGEVHLLDMRGPVKVDAAGDIVEVEFTTFTAEQDSTIMNDGGEVKVTFLGGDSRVDAVSRFGRVHSSLPGIPVGQGASTAQGMVGGGANRLVAIKASGDVHLLGSDASAQAGQTP